jgi:anti-sigma factor ChrR (cupin superfamily)
VTEHSAETPADAPLNGHLDRRTVVETASLEWLPSPSGSVWRKRVHRVGPAESGQVTSLVRYEPNACFPPHDHPQGEEILVLDGVFSDEHGDWTAGTYLLNPEGFRHGPFSREGCVLFVKLRQYPGQGREQLQCRSQDLEWSDSGRPGRQRKWLYRQRGFSDHMRLERWQADAAPLELSWPAGVELFVLSGSFRDDQGCYPQGTWLRLPPGSSHLTETASGAELYIKEGGFSYLRAG